MAHLAVDSGEPDVVPIHVLGVTDVDLTRTASSDLMAFALANLADPLEEGGYVVRHSRRALDDFGESVAQAGGRNPLAAAFPVLFPYGLGGIEASRKVKLSLKDHARWALQYHDRCFANHHTFAFVLFAMFQKREAMRSARLQMKRKDFKWDTLAVASVTLADLKKAEQQEGRKEPITNSRVRTLRRHVVAANGRVTGSDNARAQYRGMIWGTCLFLGGPTVWITINPADVHDPIAQVFAGQAIDLDKFNNLLGPDGSTRAEVITSNPYAAAEYFHFIIHAILEELFGITKHQGHITSERGILGELAAYFGVVEAQGRGTLHLHMLIWLRGTPDCDRMQELLQAEPFREKIKQYIQANVRAHADELTEESIKKMAREPQLAYSRPPNPDEANWEEANHQFEVRLVRSQQVHTCSRATCLQLRNGVLACKRRAPWPLSDEDFVDNRGNWGPKRTNGYINNYCPLLLTSMRCNNDIKLNTNGADTKDIAFYVTAYATKKQKKSHNLSALMANGLSYHLDNPKFDDIRERNRLLVYRCINVINREAELSGPQVVSYLMGYGDNFTSHYYSPMFTSQFFVAVQRMFPGLRSHLSSR